MSHAGYGKAVWDKICLEKTPHSIMLERTKTGRMIQPYFVSSFSGLVFLQYSELRKTLTCLENGFEKINDELNDIERKVDQIVGLILKGTDIPPKTCSIRRR